MVYIKTLKKVEELLRKKEENQFVTENALVISSLAILDFLKDYEIGIPENYGVQKWLLEETSKGNIVFDYADNTANYGGNVLTDFGFCQFTSLSENAIYVMITFNNGVPNYLRYDVYKNDIEKPILLKIPNEDSFYEVLDQISLESLLIPSKIIEIDGLHYLIIPRIINESCFVFCEETEEEYFSLGSNIEEIKENLLNYPKRKLSSLKI